MQEMDQNDKRGVGRSRVQNQTEKTGLENGENEKNEKKAKKTGFWKNRQKKVKKMKNKKKCRYETF